MKTTTGSQPMKDPRPLVPVIRRELVEEGQPVYAVGIREHLTCGHYVDLSTGWGYRLAATRRCAECVK